jgi:glycosyltransferase involved in cell wall biosynthesis
MTQANLFWEGTQFAYHSMAIANREYCAALSESGQIDLTIVPYEPDKFEPGDDAKLVKLKSLDLRSKGLQPAILKKRPTIWVRHRGPIQDSRRPPRGASLILMYPWEYSLIPIEYTSTLMQADEVWTPSRYSRNTMIRSGLPAEKVFVIPNGVDTQRFTPVGEKFSLPTSKSFRFLFVGATILFRKGVDILLEAYCRAFTPRDDVSLVIKETGAKESYQSLTAETLIEKYMSRTDYPEIVYLPDYMSEADLARLYRSGDVFVSSYRGEGFSLPTLEAMSCGLPVIVPEGGATDDFVTPECAWRIETRPRSVGNTIFDLPLNGEGFVLEPDIDHLVNLLRAAYHDRKAVARKGEASHKQAQRWTWHHAAGRVLQRVDALCGTTTAADWKYFTPMDRSEVPPL